MPWLMFLLFVLRVLQQCEGVFYDLNDTEYDRMPPLFGLEGNYDKCLNQPGGVYCVAKFELVGDNELGNVIKEYSQYNDRKHFNHSHIERGICVTKTCKHFASKKDLRKKGDLTMALEGCLNESIWNEYGLEAKLSVIHSCNVKGDNLNMDLGDWILLAILTFFVVINLIGSVYDIIFHIHQTENDRAPNRYLLSFSIFRNWNKLVNTDTEPYQERLRGFHGLKSIITFFVACPHVIFLGATFIDNPRDFENSYDHNHYQVIYSGLVIVQVFFVISSCLLIFKLLQFQERISLSWKHVALIILARLMRLTPTNALVVIFMGTWMRHLGGGPLWGLHVHSVAAQCQRHWWQHLLYFNNYVEEDKLCAIHYWHLATEVQLFTLGLLVYKATAARGRRLALAALALVGVLGPPIHVWLQDLDAMVLFSPESFRTLENDTYRRMHVLGHNNLACYAIGMGVGYISYYCVKNKIEYPNNKILKFLTWCVPAVIISTLLSGSMFFSDGDRPSLTVRMMFAAMHRPAIGLTVAFLLLSLVMKFENLLRGILEWRGWIVTSRLSYAVYSLHFIFIHIMLGLQRQLIYSATFNLIVYHFGVVFLSLLAAVPLYLTVEGPVMMVLEEFFTSKAAERNKKKN